MVIVEARVAGLSEQALVRFVLRARRAAGLRGGVDVLIANNTALRSLNRRFRGKDKATDVLSFPANGAGSGSPPLAGEIAISADIASQNAARLGHPVPLEIKVLVLHGILHLAGFDHERDNGEMARKELALRKALGLPSSLTERGAMRPPAPRGKVRRSSRGTA